MDWRNMKIYTDSDFDGIISAYLLKQLHPNHEVVFTNPQTINKILTIKDDIIADLPKPENFQGTHYNHHPPYTKTSLPLKSCAEVILKLHTKLKNKKNLTLIKAANKIDTAKFSKNPTPEENISMSLSLYGNKRENTFKKKILQWLLEGKTLEEIAKEEQLQQRLEKKKQKMQEFLKKLKIIKQNQWGIKFVKIEGYISQTYLYEIFKTGCEYIIKKTKKHTQITANVYEKNPVNLLKIAKKYGGAGKKNKIYILGDINIQELIEEISIEHNEKKR